MVRQWNPDGDTALFYYDRLGRLVASQNKEQRDTASWSAGAGRYSFTKYDRLGRIIEVGEKSGTSDPGNLDLLDSGAVSSWLSSGVDRQLTRTVYDEPLDITWQSSATSRKRVVASIYLENSGDAMNDSTLYSYDIAGNVKTLKQSIKSLRAVSDSLGQKWIGYDYDQISGKVNQVRYQMGRGDQFCTGMGTMQRTG